MKRSYGSSSPLLPKSHNPLLIGLALVGMALLSTPAQADCMTLLPLFQQGGSDAQIAQYTGLALAVVQSCRGELSRPIYVGPAGAPPVGAAGPPPVGAAGRPPLGAAGPPPMGAAGPPPVGRDIKRLP